MFVPAREGEELGLYLWNFVFVPVTAREGPGRVLAKFKALCLCQRRGGALAKFKALCLCQRRGGALAKFKACVLCKRRRGALAKFKACVLCKRRRGTLAISILARLRQTFM